MIEECHKKYPQGLSHEANLICFSTFKLLVIINIPGCHSVMKKGQLQQTISCYG